MVVAITKSSTILILTYDPVVERCTSLLEHAPSFEFSLRPMLALSVDRIAFEDSNNYQMARVSVIFFIYNMICQ